MLPDIMPIGKKYMNGMPMFLMPVDDMYLSVMIAPISPNHGCAGIGLGYPVDGLIVDDVIFVDFRSSKEQFEELYAEIKRRPDAQEIVSELPEPAREIVDLFMHTVYSCRIDESEVGHA